MARNAETTSEYITSKVDVEQAAHRALPLINRTRHAFGAKPIERLNLRCENVVGSCPMARALKPTGVQSVYAGVLQAEDEIWDAETEDFVDTDVQRRALRKIAKVWGKKVRRVKYIDFCCHRHFDETAMVVSLPATIRDFVTKFMEWKDGA